MTIPRLVEAFYARIWTAGDLEAASELLTEDFLFRGSLGTETRGREAFKSYARSIRASLSDYRCEILDCVGEQDRAFAQMRFSGVHTGVFRGFQPTHKHVHWLGAALFRFKGGAIAELWVLGDLYGLDALLKKNEAT
ncbi:MAG: ester cyclase [Acidobacteriia bacterium]|nr:ester cyclase [Terriglobia bacterium]